MSADDVIGRIAFGPPMSLSELRMRSHQLGSADMALVTAKLKARVAALEVALREVLVIAAPAWTECPPKDGWHEFYGDIAGIAETALGETYSEALAHARALSPTQRTEKT